MRRPLRDRTGGRSRHLNRSEPRDGKGKKAAARSPPGGSAPSVSRLNQPLRRCQSGLSAMASPSVIFENDLWMNAAFAGPGATVDDRTQTKG